MASGFRAPGWAWPLERFYHHIFATDHTILELVRTVGFQDKVFFRSPVTAQWWQGRAYPIDGANPLDAALNVLRFPATPPLDRLRFGLVVAYLKYGVRDWRPLERITAAEWSRRWMGPRVYQAIVQPLLEGKFGPYAREVNMAWLWARFKARTFKLGYFEGGFQALADALVDAVCARGGHVHLGTPVVGLHPASHLGGWELRLPDGAEHFDRIIATVPPSALGRLVPDLPSGYLAHLMGLKSLGAVVLIVALDRPLTDGLYWVNLDKREFPMLALVEHTNYVEPKHYGGDHLIYLGDYLPANHPHFDLPTEALFEEYEPALRRFNPDYSRTWVRDMWAFKAAYAQPVVPVNYSQHIPPLRTPLPGLYVASMSHVYPWDRGTNFAVEIGQRVANLVIRDIMNIPNGAGAHVLAHPQTC
ncbi:MAG: NAD(P)/FAD-dependent oxidoreductase [Ardenticatenia bacterium]|nr:NAD(P)/FAD-dependent oxidoreductase [Ardenticatenia bacterium]